MGIVIQAAKMHVALDNLTVEVQCDWDASGALELNDSAPPSYTDVRVIVRIQSGAPEGKVRELVGIAERYSSYIDVFRRALDVEVEVQMVAVPGSA